MDDVSTGTIILWLIVSIAISMVWFMWGLQVWRVWAQGKRGEADLMQAHREQQIQVARAQGRLDAANLNKQAAIVEAEAVAAQIEKIGKQLTQHDLYLKWQWIKMMDDGDCDREIIYVPTEANLPVLEALRLQNK